MNVNLAPDFCCDFLKKENKCNICCFDCYKRNTCNDSCKMSEKCKAAKTQKELDSTYNFIDNILNKAQEFKDAK